MIVGENGSHILDCIHPCWYPESWEHLQKKCSTGLLFVSKYMNCSEGLPCTAHATSKGNVYIMSLVLLFPFTVLLFNRRYVNLTLIQIISIILVVMVTKHGSVIMFVVIVFAFITVLKITWSFSVKISEFLEYWPELSELKLAIHEQNAVPVSQE